MKQLNKNTVGFSKCGGRKYGMANFKEMLLCAQSKSLFQGCSNSNTVSFAELELYLVAHNSWCNMEHLETLQISGDKICVSANTKTLLSNY